MCFPPPRLRSQKPNFRMRVIWDQQRRPLQRKCRKSHTRAHPLALPSSLRQSYTTCRPVASAQKRINCPNGETHYEIDVEKLALNYQGRSFQTTLSGLGALGAKVALQPTTLQAADAATQQWNQLLQGLAAGFNNCAV